MASAHVSLWELIDDAYVGVNRYVASYLQSAGFADIRPSHGKVFENLDAKGTRLTKLAARADMTKQAMGDLVANLESLGYVQRAIDPRDRRAKVVRLTKRGAQAVEAAQEALGLLYKQIGERTSDARLKEARVVLEAVLELVVSDED